MAQKTTSKSNDRRKPTKSSSKSTKLDSKPAPIEENNEKETEKTNSRRESKRTYVFTLKHINIDKVEQKYGIVLESNLEDDTFIPELTTRIDELGIPSFISFIDETKKQVKCSISMIDYNRKIPVDKESWYVCFWCRIGIPENITPLGCPLRFIPHQITKTYHSEISKDVYSIKECVSDSRFTQLKELQDSRIKLENNAFYLSDGAFCSYNCCASFIDDNEWDQFYRDSEKLLLKHYNEHNEEKIDFIERAPHWRQRRCYGGLLTDEQYKESFNRIEYIYHGRFSRIRQLKGTGNEQKLIPTGLLFEEKLKF